MKAAVYDGPRSLRVIEVADPSPAEDHLLIEIKACGICGTDLRIYKHGHHRVTPPRILGHELVGILAKSSPDLEGFQVGDRVGIPPILPCGDCSLCRRGITNLCPRAEILGFHRDGGFAEYVVVPVDLARNAGITSIPQGLGDVEATLAEPMGCVLNGLELAGVRSGDTVLVVGAGPLGIIHGEIAKMLGASRVIVAEESDERLEVARSFPSIDEVIDLKAEDLPGGTARLTGGYGADVISVVRSNPQIQADSLEALAPRGRLILFGALPRGASHVTLDTNIIHYKEAAVVGVTGCQPRQYRQALDMLASGNVRTDQLITHRFPLDQIQEAFDRKLSGEGLKMVIES